MKLVMTLLVRDEEDILETHLRYHLSQGVDFVIVTDNLSVDGSRDILRRYEREGVVRLIEEREDTYSQATWVTRMARLAHDEHGADWVIHSDADEFWWPKRGTLKSTLEALPPEAGILTSPRVNFLPRPQEEGSLFERMTLREVVSFDDFGDRLPPKVCHRSRPDVEVGQGNHAVRVAGLTAAHAAKPVIILHFPMRTYAQFQNKITVGGRAYQNNSALPEKTGITWRRLYRTYLDGELPDYFADRVLPEPEIRQGIRAGRLVRDHRLRNYLEGLA